MMNYKKRAKAGWNSDKETSNTRERRHSKDAIRQAEQEELVGDAYRYKAKTKHRQTRQERLERRIHRLEAMIELDESMTSLVTNRSFWREWIDKLKKRLAKLRGKRDE